MIVAAKTVYPKYSGCKVFYRTDRQIFGSFINHTIKKRDHNSFYTIKIYSVKCSNYYLFIAAKQAGIGSFLLQTPQFKIYFIGFIF